MGIVSAYCMQTCSYFERLGLAGLSLKALLYSTLLYSARSFRFWNMARCMTVEQCCSAGKGFEHVCAASFRAFAAFAASRSTAVEAFSWCRLFNDVAIYRPTQLAGQFERAQM